MRLTITSSILILSAFTSLVSAKEPEKSVTLKSGNVSLRWNKTVKGWSLHSLKAFNSNITISANQHCILYCADKPTDNALDPLEFGGDVNFPEIQYRYVLPSWKEATSPIALNRAGEAFYYLPQHAEIVNNNTIRFSYSSSKFSVTENWRMNTDRIDVAITLIANEDGWFSIATPSLFTVSDKELEFALIPGMLHGHHIGRDFSRDYAYGWNIPSEPVIFRERSTSTLTSILTAKNGVTFAVTATPGTAAEPWGYDKRNTTDWKLGLAAMNRAKELSPTLYHPVLGQTDSFMEAGESRSFSFVYTFDNNDWWNTYDYVVNNIYNFNESLKIRRNKQSLTDRLYKIHKYVVNDSTSKWHTLNCENLEIGAQEYLGGVYKAKKDAMKNADYGAMWMLGAMTSDSLITSKRLPFARNFKIKQFNDSPGYMNGSSKGQYYLRDSKLFVEEWGPYTEPIATTYYMLMDTGNIMLFTPEDQQLKSNLRDAAECLMRWQKDDGSWDVAYNDETGEEAFKDLKDYRPTFYGLVIAARLLKDNKFLDAAKKGADWLIENAVKTHRWLGVCGDTRFAADFATAQAAQALLELYELSGDKKYLDAAVSTAKFYATSVYTNPIPSNREIKINGKPAYQWEITTSGLSYEHGGIIGSCNLHGPILLASHSGMFVRMYKLTGEKIFLDMARTAAIGRDAFVDDKTGVASYYWAAMNRGAGPYPHHAWWQMGWIMDYLVAELELRSNGSISFPAGFITPKVGPHRTYGFKDGKINEDKVSLVMKPGSFESNNPNVEVLFAQNNKYLYLMLLNDLGEKQSVKITLDSNKLGAIYNDSISKVIKPYGLELIKIPLK